MGEESPLSVRRFNCTAASGLSRHFLLRSRAELAPGLGEVCSFPRGPHPLRAAQRRLLAPSREPAQSGGRAVPEHPRTPPARSESSTTAVTYSGRGLAPQLGAGWSRDPITWSGADKGPLVRRTRNPRQLPPSPDSWERGANLPGQPVPALSVRRRPSA